MAQRAYREHAVKLPHRGSKHDGEQHRRNMQRQAGKIILCRFLTDATGLKEVFYRSVNSEAATR